MSERIRQLLIEIAGLDNILNHHNIYSLGLMPEDWEDIDAGMDAMGFDLDMEEREELIIGEFHGIRRKLLGDE